MHDPNYISNLLKNTTPLHLDLIRSEQSTQQNRTPPAFSQTPAIHGAEAEGAGQKKTGLLGREQGFLGEWRKWKRRGKGGQ